MILVIDAAPAAFITGATISDAACGVYRDWPGQTSVDFTSGNTFNSVTGCTQTSLPGTNGACATCATSN